MRAHLFGGNNLWCRRGSRVTLMYGLRAPSYFDLDTWLIQRYTIQHLFSSGVVNPGFMNADVTQRRVWMPTETVVMISGV